MDVTLKWITKKQDIGEWTGFSWLRVKFMIAELI
jgi:hypothetical protein